MSLLDRINQNQKPQVVQKSLLLLKTTLLK